MSSESNEIRSSDKELPLDFLSETSNGDFHQQKVSWDALRAEIALLVEKISITNIQETILKLFRLNIIRGKGILTQSLIRAQARKVEASPIYASLVTVINSKFPEIGELLLARLITIYRRTLANPSLLSTTKSTLDFLANLIATRVAHEILGLQLILELLEVPSDHTVVLTCHFLKRTGHFFFNSANDQNSLDAFTEIYTHLRTIYHESQRYHLTERATGSIEDIFKLWKIKFKGLGFSDALKRKLQVDLNIDEQLDLVEDEDLVTHFVDLSDDTLDTKKSLDEFQYSSTYAQDEANYADIKLALLGEDDGDEDDEEDEGTELAKDQEEPNSTSSMQRNLDDKNSPSTHRDGDQEVAMDKMAQIKKKIIEEDEIYDLAESEKVELKKKVYLAIVSSLSYMEVAHKLLKSILIQGTESIGVEAIIESCLQERTYKKDYGCIAEALINSKPKKYKLRFENAFIEHYFLLHRLEALKLRNLGEFFAYLFFREKLDWETLFMQVHISDDKTNSSMRIFLKVLFQTLAEMMGPERLTKRLNQTVENTPENLLEIFASIGEEPANFPSLFPTNNPKGMRYSIDFFTAINLGFLTNRLRKILTDYIPHLKKPIPNENSSDTSDVSSSEDDFDVHTDEDEARKRRRYDN